MPVRSPFLLLAGFLLSANAWAQSCPTLVCRIEVEKIQRRYQSMHDQPQTRPPPVPLYAPRSSQPSVSSQTPTFARSDTSQQSLGAQPTVPLGMSEEEKRDIADQEKMRELIRQDYVNGPALLHGSHDRSYMATCKLHRVADGGDHTRDMQVSVALKKGAATGFINGTGPVTSNGDQVTVVVNDWKYVLSTTRSMLSAYSKDLLTGSFDFYPRLDGPCQRDFNEPENVLQENWNDFASVVRSSVLAEDPIEAQKKAALLERSRPVDWKTNHAIAGLYYENQYFRNAAYAYDSMLFRSEMTLTRQLNEDYYTAALDRLALLYYALGDDENLGFLLRAHDAQRRLPVVSYLSAARQGKDLKYELESGCNRGEGSDDPGCAVFLGKTGSQCTDRERPSALCAWLVGEKYLLQGNEKQGTTFLKAAAENPSGGIYAVAAQTDLNRLKTGELQFYYGMATRVVRPQDKKKAAQLDGKALDLGLAKGRCDEAARYFEKAAHLDPASVHWKEFIMCMEFRPEVDAGDSVVWRNAVGYAPGSTSYSLLGKALAKEGDTEGAERAFRKAVDLDGKSLPKYNEFRKRNGMAALTLEEFNREKKALQ